MAATGYSEITGKMRMILVTTDGFVLTKTSGSQEPSTRSHGSILVSIDDMKIIFDILATIAFIFVWYKTFVFFGEMIPGFGYVIGAMIGMLPGGLAAVVVHLIGYPFEKLFNR